MKKVLIIGYSNDSTISFFLSQISNYECNYDFLDLHHYYTSENLEIVCENESMILGDKEINLNSYSGVYQRLMHPSQSEEYMIENQIAISRYYLLKKWLIIFRGNLINSFFSGWENSSKLLQSYLMTKYGDATIPQSLSTSNEESAINFMRKDNKQIIYKSNSSIRSIVNKLDNSMYSKINSLKYCPSLFQKLIVGYDVRIHSVGSELFGVKIFTDAVDYRYHKNQGTFKTMTPYFKIPDKVKSFINRYTKSRGIIFAGFDFKISDTNDWYCLEMNPMPGYDGYDEVLNGSISKNLIKYLINIK